MQELLQRERERERERETERERESERERERVEGRSVWWVTKTSYSGEVGILFNDDPSLE